MEIITLGNPNLRKKAKNIIELDDDIITFATDLKKMMYANKGIGLAAPQVNRQIKLFIFDADYFRAEFKVKVEDKNSYVFNPMINIPDDAVKETIEEGCLSVPNVYADVERAHQIYVQYMNLAGEIVKFEYRGYLARVFLHENDHLQGRLFIDLINSKQKKKLIPKLKMLIEKENK